MLGALLSRFSDEKLKSIQLSLQEEQEIRDSSREEVEKSLRQSGLASMADGLKDDIEKGIAWDDTPLTAYTPHIIDYRILKATQNKLFVWTNMTTK